MRSVASGKRRCRWRTTSDQMPDLPAFDQSKSRCKGLKLGGTTWAAAARPAPVPAPARGQNPSQAAPTLKKWVAWQENRLARSTARRISKRPSQQPLLQCRFPLWPTAHLAVAQGVLGWTGASLAPTVCTSTKTQRWPTCPQQFRAKKT
eukprot:jgi/Astpho2/4626/Aster-00200